MVWDDVVKDWIPRFGYKKAVAEQTKNWMMPYKVSRGASNMWSLRTRHGSEIIFEFP